MAVRDIEVKIRECTCERCGYVWCPDLKLENGIWITPMPVRCAAAKCKTPYWNVPKADRKTKKPPK